MPTKPRSRCPVCHHLHTSTGTCNACRMKARAARRPDLRTDQDRRAATVQAWRARYGDLCPGYLRAPHPARDLTADHITPVASGGPETGPLAVLCISCNSRKRAAGHHVVLITGPPCAGKTTYAKTHSQPRDLILDQDDIARELGSTRYWNHDPATLARAQQVMRSRIATLAARRTGRAWVIRCVPSGWARAALANILAAEQTILLLPPGHVLVQRAQHRPQMLTTITAINTWMSRYTEHERDTLITTP